MRRQSVNFGALVTKYILLFISAFSIFCYPIMNSGYYGDDALNSFIGSTMAVRGISLSEQYIINLRTFLPSRLSVLHLYHWVFLLFTDLTTYKLYSSTVLAAALISTYFVIKSFVNNSLLPFLIIIFTLLIGIQFREYGDPVLVFNGATSISLILLNLSILTFIKFLKCTKTIFLFSSLILFTLGCLSYELIYPFCVIYFVISKVLGNKSKKEAGKYLSLFATPVVLLTLQNIIFRVLIELPKDVSNPSFHKAYEVSLELGAISLVFVKQLIASLPLSNLIINPFGSLTFNNLLVSRNSILLLVLLTLVFGSIFYYSLEGINKLSREDRDSFSRKNNSLLVIFAIMLLVVPNGIIALSPKYQGEIIWGSGYVSIFFGYFGASILICLSIYGILTKINEKWCLLGLSLFLGATAAANLYANNKTVEVLNTFWKNPRTVAEESLQRGLLSEIETGAAYIFINSNYPWDVTSFIHKYSGKFLNQEEYTGGEGRFFGGKTNVDLLISDRKSRLYEVFSPKANLALSKHLMFEIDNNYYYDLNGEKNIYYFDYYADSDDSGYALLAGVQKAFVSQDYINGVASNKVKVYIRMPHQRGVYSTMSANFLALDPTTLRPISNVTMLENEFKLISQGIGWKLIEIDSSISKYLIDVKSLRINTSQKVFQTSIFPASILNSNELKFENEKAAKIVHIGFATPFENSQIALSPVKLGAEFSIVLRARLSENFLLPPYAHIVGNHPGKNNFEGFVIQRNAARDNTFDLTFGNGKEWKHALEFTLTSNKDTFIAVSVKDGKGIAVVDKTITSVDLGGGIQDSSMPLYVGNFIGKDRPFPGKVSELLITRTALSEEILLKFRDTARTKR
jgi:hypothetical protein